MYELVFASQTNRWQQVLDIFNITDIYYSCEYLTSALKLDSGEAALFYFIDDAGEGEVAYPFIKRQLKEESLLFHDVTSPFGYGGPVLKVKGDGYKLASSFLNGFADYCHSNKVIAEFIRFHPLFKNAEFFKDELHLIPVSETYTLSLNHLSLQNELINEESLYTIKKLGTVKHMFDFLVLYYSSVRLNEGADSYYFFTNDYFESLVSSLGSNLHLFGAYKNNKLLAACYLLAKGDVIYHHLSGKTTDLEAHEAEKELVKSIAEWGAENNYLHYHLGAGHIAGFGTSGMAANHPMTSTYFISRLVHDQEVYSAYFPMKEAELIKRYGNA